MYNPQKPHRVQAVTTKNREESPAPPHGSRTRHHCQCPRPLTPLLAPPPACPHPVWAPGPVLCPPIEPPGSRSIENLGVPPSNPRPQPDPSPAIPRQSLPRATALTAPIQTPVSSRHLDDARPPALATLEWPQSLCVPHVLAVASDPHLQNTILSVTIYQQYIIYIN